MNTSPTNVDEETPLLSSPKLRQKGQVTPLPKLQVGIALLLELCEPITSQVIYPFINELVGNLDIIGGDKRKVGYYAGLIESLFFATEALTTLQWGRLSDRTGRKPVMLLGLFGVKKSIIGELTDTSNRAEAYALLPVAWAAGVTVGPLIGGSLSNPHKRFPKVFTHQFWIDYPYFLPCLASAGIVFAFIIITYFFFKETLPKREWRSMLSESTLTDSPREIQSSLREILVWPVLISIANYISLAFLDIMLNALLPLLFAMPIELGGLGFDPPTIGYILGSYGAAVGIFSIFFSAKILRRFGEKTVFSAGTASFIPIFLLMPAMSICARTWGVGASVWTLVSIELLLMLMVNMAYGPIFIYITASADRRSLGATNGLSQTSVSVHAIAGGYVFYQSMFGEKKELMIEVKC
ncbi:hypothetical protein NP233_g7351 [Leucocoprinus birnbaumii]|uniref:Major facilitator superfamily (MFS) profile domain-containing protein n=1 Tax=Leucocoprinus birnbaumii TaxID=56174 RepID=A0AAD5VPG0_9AGAR|nr:hypothetical protein NP233_g7351 [Leucocoprinus birnbaumii]